MLVGLVPAAPAVAAEFAVTVGDFFFEPDRLVVNAGDSVTWNWDGTAPHNVSADDGAFASETQTSGSFSFTFEQEGSFTYLCTIHPDSMVGEVTVLAAGEPLPEVPPAPRPAPMPGPLPAADDNVAAALAWSALFDDGTAPTVLLGRDDLFADPLSSGAVQGLLDAPLLLTATGELDSRVAAELQRLGAEEVVIFGGTAAISAAVEDALAGSGYTTSRVSGSGRVETAVEAARTFFPQADTALLARAGTTGDDPTQAFADSLAAGGAAARQLLPILLSDSASLSSATADYLAESAIATVIVVGGTAAISPEVVAALEALDVTVERIAGPTRFDTAVALRSLAFPTRPPEVALLVEGQAPDAWASGFAAASAAESALVLLTNGDALPPPTIAPIVGDVLGRLAPVCGPYVTRVACDNALTAVQNVPFPAPGTLSTALSGDAEVPPGDPNASGYAYVLPIPGVADAVCYEYATIDLGGPPSAAHIHAGAAGDAGPAVIPLSTTAAPEGFVRDCAFDVDPAVVQAVFDDPGAHYVNVHTDEFDGGAVRGQLLPTDFIGIAELQPSQEVPPADVMGGGFGMLWTAVGDHSIVCYQYSYGLANGEAIMAAHIHQAPFGENGPVVHPLQMPAAEGEPAVAVCEPASEDLDVDDLQANPGDYYLNLHTEQFPDGALRGQVENPLGGAPAGQ